MKTIPLPKSGNTCPLECNAQFIYNIDEDRCPLCRGCCPERSLKKYITTTQLEKSYKEFLNKFDYASYCMDCHVMFDIGCYHCDLGAQVDRHYYAKFISKYTISNEYEFEGMPWFESIEELLHVVPLLEVEWTCMCTDKCLCPNDTYNPKDLTIECECK